LTRIGSVISRHVLNPLWQVMRGTYAGPLRRRLSASQYLSEDQVRQRQFRDAQSMIAYAYEHCRFYRRRFDQLGVLPGDIRDLADLAKLPVLSKDDIRENLGDMVSDEFRRGGLIWRRTGGSTGVPLQLYRDRAGDVAKQALARRHNEWASFFDGERKAALWGDLREQTSLQGKAYNALLGRTIYLDTLKMNERNMLEFARKIQRTRTRLLFGHGHSLYFFARFLNQEKGPRLRFDAILSSAEMLPPEERKVVEETFASPVFDRYGCEEVGIVASECAEHDGLHVAAEGLLVEVVDGDELKPGRVVVTDLLNRGTPLIRYEIGDLATVKAGRCSCGRGLPRIGKVIGRTSDFLFTPEGTMVSGISILDTMTIHIRGLKQVQIVQEKLDELTLNVVRDNDFSEETLAAIARDIPRYFGPSMKYQIVYLDSIPLTGRGKFQFSISRLSGPKAG
jgi:phenylacetate-CoA ligase